MSGTATPPAAAGGPWLWRSTTLAGFTLGIPLLSYFGLLNIFSRDYFNLPAHLAEFAASSAALVLALLTFRSYNSRERIGLDMRSVFSLRPYGRSAAVLAVLLAADLAVSWAGIRLMDIYSPDAEGPAMLERIWTAHGNWFFAAAGTMFLAACEEMMLRGLVLNYITKRAGFTKALLWSSFLFMLLHGDRNPAALLVIFSGGLIYGMAYRLTGGLGVPCLLHGLHNLAMRSIVLLGLSAW